MTDIPEPIKNKKPMYTRPKFIVSMIAGVIFLILIFQNWDSMPIDIFFWKAELPAAILFLIFSLIGFTVGWLLKRPKTAEKRAK